MIHCCLCSTREHIIYPGYGLCDGEHLCSVSSNIVLSEHIIIFIVTDHRDNHDIFRLYIFIILIFCMSTKDSFFRETFAEVSLRSLFNSFNVILTPF